MTRSRRSFLATGLALPAVASATRSEPEPQTPARPQSPVKALSSGPELRYKVLGKTGLRVTAVGFGCMITSDGSVVERAADMGITYFDTARNYLADRTRTRLMHYAGALRDGLPIATGGIEGACRYLVKDRMDRTGARWSLTGAEAVLRLRAIRASGDFDAYWVFHLAREKERNHASRYEGAVIPDPLPAPKPRLRRVK